MRPSSTVFEFIFESCIDQLPRWRYLPIMDPQSFSSVMPVHRIIVPGEWMDGNGHVNAAYYQLMVKDPAIHAHEEWGYGGTYCAQSGRSSFVLESHVLHLSEVKAADTIKVTTRITGLDDKRLYLLFEIWNESAGQLSALVQYMTIHVLMGEKPRSDAFPDALRARLEALRMAHAAEPLPSEASRLRPLGGSTRTGVT